MRIVDVMLRDKKVRPESIMILSQYQLQVSQITRELREKGEFDDDYNQIHVSTVVKSQGIASSSIKDFHVNLWIRFGFGIYTLILRRLKSSISWFRYLGRLFDAKFLAAMLHFGPLWTAFYATQLTKAMRSSKTLIPLSQKHSPNYPTLESMRNNSIKLWTPENPHFFTRVH